MNNEDWKMTDERCNECIENIRARLNNELCSTCHKWITPPEKRAATCKVESRMCDCPKGTHNSIDLDVNEYDVMFLLNEIDRMRAQKAPTIDSILKEKLGDLSLPILLWVDDQLDEPDMSGRHAPPGYLGVKTTMAACRLIKTGKVSHIDFDHDLGDGFLNSRGGYIIAKYIEKLAYFKKITRMTWNIHSANSVGRRDISFAMTQADFFWDKWESEHNY